MVFFFFSSRRRHTRLTCDWSSDVCSSDLGGGIADQQLAEGREGDAAAGEQRGAGADRGEGNAARDEARDDRRSAAEKQKRRDWKHRAHRKQQERGGRRGPGGAAELVGVDAELLANKGIERGVLVGHHLVG